MGAKKRWGGPRPGSGRKPGPAEERRHNKVMVGFNDDEFARLNAVVGAEPFATFIRRIVLRHLERATPRRRRGAHA